MVAKQRSRSRWGLVRRGISWLAVLVLVVLAVVVLIFSTTPGGRMIALSLNRLGSGPSQNIEIDRIDGLLSGSTRIGHVLLSDASGEPWLLLKGITIEWSPLALLSAGLAVDDFTIERVELARLPQADDSGSESSALVLPLAFDIKRFSAMDIVVGEPVAGRVARFEARGSAKLDAAMTTALADLVVKRTDGVGGELTLDADYQEAEDRFNISAKLNEPAGGVMANLLGLFPEDAISVTATSQGSLTDWQLNANGLINDEIVADATMRLVAGEAGEMISLEAGGLFERFLPPSLSQIVAGRSELLVEGLIEPDRNGAVIDVFTFSSDRLSADGRGRVAREGQVDLTLSVSPRPGAVALSFGEGASRVSLSVPEAKLRVSGSAEEAALNVEVAADRVAGSGYSADAITAVVTFDRFSLATRSGTGSVDVKIGAVGSSNDILARALAGGVTLSGKVALAEDGAISSDRIRIQTGVADVAIEGATYDSAGALQASLSGSVRNAVLSEQASAMLGTDTDFKGEISLDEAGALIVQDFQLSSEFAAASGGVALGSDGEISGDIEASLSNLAGVNDAVSGGLKLSATISGQSSAPAFDARLEGQSLQVEGRDLS
ncbi:MAG: hypothetical protein ABJN75_08265, partial [Hoeflea sp.]|uniref:hypothetical protein n=1 Tax=Hoeflea sp. TaxID=1940281 RepID=UPI003297C6F2